MKVYHTLILMAICCSVNLVHAQDIHGGGSHDGTYYPGSGVTIWEESSIGRIIYYPTADGSKVILADDGLWTEVDCEIEPERCRGLLEGASKGTSPETPDQPDKDGKNPNKPGKPGKGNKPGKGSKKQSFYQQLNSEVSELKTGQVFFKTKEGKWVEIKDKKVWLQKIIQLF